jgi:hypothetical protein
VSIRIDALGGIFAAGLATYLIYGPGSKAVLPTNIGFSLALAGEVFCLILCIL